MYDVIYIKVSLLFLQAEKTETERKLHQQQAAPDGSNEKEEVDKSTFNKNPEKEKESVLPLQRSSEDNNRRIPVPQNHSFKPSQPTAFVRFKKNGRHFGSYRPISKRREILGEEKYFNVRRFDADIHDLDDSLENGCHEDEFGTRDLYKDYQHNPVLECVNQILLRDHEEMEASAYKQDKKATGRFHYQCHSIKEQDEEEISGEEEKEKKEETEVIESQSSSENAKTSVDAVSVEEESKVISSEPAKWSSKEKIPSPPIKAQLLEEKACLQMASQRLTVVSNREFEELDKKETSEEQKTSPPPKPPMKNGFLTNKNLVPPALPPKPPQLGAKGLYQKKISNLRANQNLNTIANHQHLKNVSSAVQDQKNGTTFSPESIQDISKKNNLEESGKNVSNEHQKSILQENRMNQAPLPPEKPRQRQILSNGSLKLALNQDSNQQTFTNGHDHRQENNFCATSSSFEEKLESMNISEIQNNSNSLRHRSGGKNLNKTDNQTDSNSLNRHTHNHEARRAKTNLHNHSPLKGSMEELPSSPGISKSNSHCGKIRVGSSVSSLITGSSGNSIVNELTKGESEGVIVLPKVSQMVRRFEDLGTGIGRESPDTESDVDGNEALRRNFEEFKLEDVDMDSVGSGDVGGRPAGDGAEARASVVQNGISSNGGCSNGGGSYEHFLEATGLSQKSILTPSRMYSNHRNVLKPKDVKHRSRVLKAAAVNERNNNISNGPIVKYWIEPFL